MKGIKREFSIARTPQQNGVAKRKNRTLIEAARTMLVNFKLPITFWAEAINIACYVLNRTLVIKPHNKTPYEIIRGRPSLIDFMKPFGRLVTILNTRDYLGKFDEKANEGFFVRYYVDDQVTRSEFEGLLQQERQTKHINSTNSFNTVSSHVNTAGPSFVNAASPSLINAAETLANTNAFKEHPFERFSPFKNVFSLPQVPIMTLINDTGIFGNAYDDEVMEKEVDMNNVVSSYTI
nr:ribonuclease H-like domain-containing protein [Tanacetum cinerariifolium]